MMLLNASRAAAGSAHALRLYAQTRTLQPAVLAQTIMHVRAAAERFAVTHTRGLASAAASRRRRKGASTLTVASPTDVQATEAVPAAVRARAKKVVTPPAAKDSPQPAAARVPPADVPWFILGLDVSTRSSGWALLDARTGKLHSAGWIDLHQYASLHEKAEEVERTLTRIRDSVEQTTVDNGAHASTTLNGHELNGASTASHAASAAVIDVVVEDYLRMMSASASFQLKHLFTLAELHSLVLWLCRRHLRAANITRVHPSSPRAFFGLRKSSALVTGEHSQELACAADDGNLDSTFVISADSSAMSELASSPGLLSASPVASAAPAQMGSLSVRKTKAAAAQALGVKAAVFAFLTAPALRLFPDGFPWRYKGRKKKAVAVPVTKPASKRRRKTALTMDSSIDGMVADEEGTLTVAPVEPAAPTGRFCDTNFDVSDAALLALHHWALGQQQRQQQAQAENGVTVIAAQQDAMTVAAPQLASIAATQRQLHLSPRSSDSASLPADKAAQREYFRQKARQARADKLREQTLLQPV